MNKNHIFYLMLTNGVWRTLIEIPCWGVIYLYVPKDKVGKVKRVLREYGVIGIQYNVKSLNNPLKFKKYTYKVVSNEKES